MEFAEKAKSLGKVVLEKGKELGKVAKINIDIVTMESQISDYKKQIGDILYKEKISTDNDEIKKVIVKIDELVKDIEEKKKEIKK